MGRLFPLGAGLSGQWAQWAQLVGADTLQGSGLADGELARAACLSLGPRPALRAWLGRARPGQECWGWGLRSVGETPVDLT